MKVIIAGSRDFNNYQKLKEACDIILSDIKEPIEIVSGGARGADALGEKYAAEKGYALTKFPADWNQFGNRAGFIRNKQMAEYALMLIAFWDGQSRGTKMMIDLAKSKKLKVTVITEQ